MSSVDDGAYRSIRRSFVRSAEFIALPERAQLVLLVAAVEFGPSGIEKMPLEALAHSLAVNATYRLRLAALRILVEKSFIASADGVTWLRGQLLENPHLRSSDPKHRLNIQRHVADLPQCALVADYVRAHSDWFPPSDDVVAKRLKWVSDGKTLGKTLTKTLGKTLGKQAVGSSEVLQGRGSSEVVQGDTTGNSERASSETALARAPVLSEKMQERFDNFLARIPDASRRDRTRKDLLATLTEEGAAPPPGQPFDGARVRAVDHFHMVETCEVVAEMDLRDPNAAGWMVLAKLFDSFDAVKAENEVMEQKLEASEKAAEQQREEKAADAARVDRERSEMRQRIESDEAERRAADERNERRIIAWRDTHPDETRAIEAKALADTRQFWPAATKDTLTVRTSVADEILKRALAVPSDWAERLTQKCRAEIGDVDESYLRKKLEPYIRGEGFEAVSTAMGYYSLVQSNHSKAATFKWFLESIGQWIECAKQPLVEDGVITPTGHRVTETSRSNAQ